MLKYILIWLCIGYVIALVYFIYYHKFDVNNFFDWFKNVLERNGLLSKYNVTFQIINGSEKYRQIFVGAIVVIEIVIWPLIIPDLIRTFKRKLR